MGTHRDKPQLLLHLFIAHVITFGIPAQPLSMSNNAKYGESLFFTHTYSIIHTRRTDAQPCLASSTTATSPAHRIEGLNTQHPHSLAHPLTLTLSYCVE
jgi:hypothetical protein